MATTNPLKYYIDELGTNLYKFSQWAQIHPSSLYPIYNGERPPNRPLALRICKATGGKLNLRHFGFED